jgi:hypothetical protein
MALALPGKILRPEFARFGDYEIELAQFGQGQWSAFRALDIDLNELTRIAREWGRQLERIERPWLCWNVDSDWCLVQQKLVREAGWTPLVGFDPRVGPPRRVIPESVVFDFNAELRLPLLYPHFPLEFAFLFSSKIAFWHSDLLIRRENMRDLARRFDDLADGATAACWADPGLRHRHLPWRKRYWELVGCTTRAASRDQFEKGCGWWMAYWAHPNQARGNFVRRWYYWDHGAGIWYWHKRAGGDCEVLDAEAYAEGHFTKIGNKAYVGSREPNGSDVRRRMSDELARNFDLRQACESLGLSDLLESQSAA